MSKPRQILPGSTYLITRRTERRHMLLRPDEAMNQNMIYLLAISARRYGILVHGFVVMSTHIHLVITDVRGVLPRFLNDFHRLGALTTKVLRKWEGSVWDHGQTSVVRLATNEAVDNAIAYTLANPVTAGLVRNAREWPGAKSDVDDLGGGVMHARRPSVFLNPRNRRWTPTATLTLALPPHVEPSRANEWREAVKAKLAEYEERGRKEVALQEWNVLGARRAAKVSPYQRATSFEPIRSRDPTFAVGGVAGAYLAAVCALRAFRAAYSAALDRWRAGFRYTVFPAGTWLMARLHSASVAT